MKLPLYGKLLLWLIGELVLIAALYVAIPGRNGAGWNVLLTEPVRERLISVGESLGRALEQAPPAAREAVLQRYSSEYGVAFGLQRLIPPPPAQAAPPPAADGLPVASAHPPSRRELAESIRLEHLGGFGEFSTYLVVIPLRLTLPNRPPQFLHLIAVASDLPSLLRFLKVADWVAFVVLVTLASALLWWPFILGITRTAMQLTHLTQRIAHGHFEVRVRTSRRDELGELAQSVNDMAERLHHLVSGQKRFLADIAHELTSPLARIHIALGILQPRIDSAARPVFDGIAADVAQLSEMMNELLLFSRTSHAGTEEVLETVPLRELVAEVLARENAQAVKSEVAPELRVSAARAPLARALANLVRNALRYGGADRGGATVTAENGGDRIRLYVRDRGPGVPEPALPRLGEPFFRVQDARGRDSGGYGLGLAIVRRSVEACGGEVFFRNRAGGGFEAEIQLAPAPTAEGLTRD
jgi:two-component system sensor histidine kinase CpxA